jgi:hypothetical protein
MLTTTPLSLLGSSRFDSEQSVSQEEVQRERSLREKLGRERDVLAGEVLGLRQQLEVN